MSLTLKPALLACVLSKYLSYLNELFKYSGIINSLLGAVYNKNGYLYTEEMKVKSEKLVFLLETCEDKMLKPEAIDEKVKVIEKIEDAANELRECSAEFLEKNLI